MAAQATVVPTGRNCSILKTTSCSSMCCCSFQFPLTAPFSERHVKVFTGACSYEQLPQGSCLLGGERDGAKRSFRNQELKPLSTGNGVASTCGRACEALQSRDGFSADSESIRASTERKSGGAHLFREVSGLRYRSCKYGYTLSRRKGGFSNSFSDESSWQDYAKRNMTQFGGERGFLTLDERLTNSCRFSDSKTVHCLSEDGEADSDERMSGRAATILDGSGGEQGNGNERSSRGRQPTSNIPISELRKIEDLRFSGDMQEGDSGPQVLNLQRALFWLGHLRGLSLTGYFGPETTRAVQELHTSHGIHSPGVWSHLSREVLWKHLHPVAHQAKSAQEISERSMEQKQFPQSPLADTWRLVKNVSGKVMEESFHASQALQQWHPSSLTEFGASVFLFPSPTLASGMVGIVLLSAVALSSIAKLLHFFFSQARGQPVKKRVMSWRSDVDLGLRLAARQGTLSSSNGLQNPLKSSQGGSVVRQFRSRCGSNSTNKQEENVLERLVLFDGQVLQGHSSVEQRDSSQSRFEIVSSALRAQAAPISSSERLYHAGSELESQKRSHGLDAPEKPEVDPPRKVSLGKWQRVQSENSPRLTGGEQRWSGSDRLRVWHPGWAASLSGFFATLFLNRERDHPFPCGAQKTSPRRAVVQRTAHRQIKPSEREVLALGSFQRYGKFEKGAMAHTEALNWHDQDELDLKKQVEELQRTVNSVEQTRAAAVRALAEEKLRSLELEVKVSRQRELAASLEEEVRVLKDSHEALLASLRRKYSSSAAARAAAALLYQNWDPSDTSARV